MASRNWKQIYAEKCVDAKDAISHLRNGQTIFLSSGVGEPLLLTNTLAEMAPRFRDIEVIHLAAVKEESNLARPELLNSFRYNTFFIGQGSSDIMEDTVSDYTPMNIRELPAAMSSGVIVVDVALIQVSPPDSFGLCSLGVAVDVTKAAVENAKLVIAQVNDEMPMTMGDSLVPVDAIDFLVEGTAALPEVESAETDPISLTIGRHIANLISDGTTLHFDRSSISAATMRYLDTKKDLGIHTDILTDNIMRLIRSRSVTNRLKRLNKNKTIATMVMGSSELYKAVHGNPYIEILPIDQVNDPFVISQNDNMVSVSSVQEIELTGMARADFGEFTNIGNLPSSMDFVNGARRSQNGCAILALPSTSPDGLRSRIVSLMKGRGVFFPRTTADYIVTEYGHVNLFGLSVRERAIALIQIAHPKFRQQLMEEAKRLKYVGKEQPMPPEARGGYPHHYEFIHKLDDGTEIFFRPVQPCDARRLQRMFYSFSPKAIRLRYHGMIKALSNETAQRIAAVDYSQDIAIVGLTGPRRNPKIVAEGRYMYNPVNNMGEFDIVVHEEYHRRGLGFLLTDYLKKIAYSRGLSGVYAEVIQRNEATIAMLNKAWPMATKQFSYGSCTFVLRFPEEAIKRPKDSIIVYSGQFGDHSYGENHPFDPGRARAALQMITSQGYLNEPWMRVEEPRMITREKLTESHSPEYIDALESANSGEWKEEFIKFNLGSDDCPVFRGLYDYVLLYTSATLTGVELITNDNANVVFNPLGGFHHASRSHAEGFCYINDVIAAIDAFLARGFRVAYIDIDAHHGNGVQDAYYRDDRVLVVSLHESGRTLYPWSGFETETGEEIGKGYTVNIPLPEGSDDEAFESMFDRVVTPAVEKFAPSVVVSVIGTDTHKSDPLANLSLTNNGMAGAVKRIRSYSSHLLLLGGGGYDMGSTIRGWCRMWAVANRVDALPDYLLTMGGSFLGGGDMQGASIVDMSYMVSGGKKSTIMRELDRITRFHEKNTLPLITPRAKRNV